MNEKRGKIGLIIHPKNKKLFFFFVSLYSLCGTLIKTSLNDFSSKNHKLFRNSLSSKPRTWQDEDIVADNFVVGCCCVHSVMRPFSWWCYSLLHCCVFNIKNVIVLRVFLGLNEHIHININYYSFYISRILKSRVIQCAAKNDLKLNSENFECCGFPTTNFWKEEFEKFWRLIDWINLDYNISKIIKF